MFDVALGNLSAAKRKVIISMRDTYDRIIRKVIQRGRQKGLFAPYTAKLVGFMISSMIPAQGFGFTPGRAWRWRNCLISSFCFDGH